MPSFPSKPTKLRVSGKKPPKVKPPTKIRTSSSMRQKINTQKNPHINTPGPGYVRCRKAETTRDCRYNHKYIDKMAFHKR